MSVVARRPEEPWTSETAAAAAAGSLVWLMLLQDECCYIYIALETGARRRHGACIHTLHPFIAGELTRAKIQSRNYPFTTTGAIRLLDPLYISTPYCTETLACADSYIFAVCGLWRR